MTMRRDVVMNLNYRRGGTYDKKTGLLADLQASPGRGLAWASAGWS